jgi:small-conductance mechanosensitive channel
LSVQLKTTNNVQEIMERVRQGMTAIPNILETATPEVGISEFNSDKPKLTVRPYALPVHHDQVAAEWAVSD